jgi:hypothetical protein
VVNWTTKRNILTGKYVTVARVVSKQTPFSVGECMKLCLQGRKIGKGVSWYLRVKALFWHSPGEHSHTPQSQHPAQADIRNGYLQNTIRTFHYWPPLLENEISDYTFIIFWNICSKPWLWNQQRRPLLGNGSAYTRVARQWLSERYVCNNRRAVRSGIFSVVGAKAIARASCHY